MFQSTHPHGVRQSLRPSATLFHVVSIHAPTRGATSHDCYSPFSVSCFNPRTHTGCDLVVLTSSNNLIIVSIHAPTRGATFVYRGTDRPQFCRFNPRTHTGCDSLKQSNIFHNVSFNPRTHTGCDEAICWRDTLFAVSIHAPTRGATVWRIFL